MPAAGFYPRGGGRLEAWIEPASPRRGSSRARAAPPDPRDRRGRQPPRRHRRGGCATAPSSASRNLASPAEIELVQWSSPGQGAALSLIAEHDGAIPATFVGLGERGKPSEAVADEAVDQLLAFEAVAGAAVDPHSADQVLLPLAFAPGRSEFTVSEVTEHLRTNVDTIGAFLDRSITIEEPEGEGQPGRVVIE